MVKKSSEEPGDKASERLKQMMDARFPKSLPDEEQPKDPVSENEKEGPAKKKAAKKSPKKKK
ncbi:MAG: hypothetical protein ICV84_19920 [Flavisolibacter sp.]|nr:hypothetical protein [Flavisolibacter sp.]